MSSRGPRESDTCRDFVLPRLKAAGWADDQIIEQFPITDGRIVTVGQKHRRDKPLRADYVLEYRPGVPVAVVEAKREYAIPAEGMQQAKRYGRLLDLPLAYATNGKGIVEDDRDTGREREHLSGFPSPAEAWARFRAWKGISDDRVADGLVLPFNRALRTFEGGVKEPRYYQRVAINRTVQAVLAGDKRLLLTMATGTGKTFVALQLMWKLWTSTWCGDRKPRMLYLADRNVLIDYPMASEFIPAFGKGPIWKLKGEAKAGREIYFGIYQALADGGDASGIYRDFAPDFFDLIVVDECHRGSAGSGSSWRAILEHFSSATQVGMTATPKRDDTVDTYDYFGSPLYEYSLAQGIDDGFLAPYRVRRVVLSPDAHGWAPEQGQLDLFGKEIPQDLYTTRDFERVVSLLTRTEAAAKHLSAFMARAVGRMGKTIVFCVNQEHADQMRRALHNANSDLVRQHPNYVVRIVSDEGEIGRRHLSDFIDPEKETPVIATTSQLLSTGVDVQTLRNVVIFRPIGSMSLFKQIIGRGTRLFPDDDKLSFDIIDYSGATALFEDPEFDGPPERIDRDEIDGDGTVVYETVVEEPEPAYDYGEETDESLDPADLPEPRRKLYVDDAEVWVTAEALYQLDPTTDRLRLIEYRDYVIDTVRTLFPDPTALRENWASGPGRHEVVEALASRGIEATELAERAGLGEADPLDVLVHLAWNQPLATRTDRVRRVRKEHADFFEHFRPEARAVMDELLTKYAEHGVDQLDDLAVLQVPPLSELGSPAELAARFGGVDELRAAVARLQDHLYAA